MLVYFDTKIIQYFLIFEILVTILKMTFLTIDYFNSGRIRFIKC